MAFPPAGTCITILQGSDPIDIWNKLQSFRLVSGLLLYLLRSKSQSKIPQEAELLLQKMSPRNVFFSEENKGKSMMQLKCF
jgi:hypothetical protein